MTVTAMWKIKASTAHLHPKPHTHTHTVGHCRAVNVRPLKAVSFSEGSASLSTIKLAKEFDPNINLYNQNMATLIC